VGWVTVARTRRMGHSASLGTGLRDRREPEPTFARLVEIARLTRGRTGRVGDARRAGIVLGVGAVDPLAFLYAVPADFQRSIRPRPAPVRTATVETTAPRRSRRLPTEYCNSVSVTSGARWFVPRRVKEHGYGDVLGVTRKIVPFASSLTSSAPSWVTATPAGRPQTLSPSRTNPVRKSSYSPVGWPSFKRTRMTL
jgi:hypothetical protein